MVKDAKIVSSENGKFCDRVVQGTVLRVVTQRVGICGYMAGNPWNPRVHQIRGGRDAAILEPISKKFSRLNENRKIQSTERNRNLKRGNNNDRKCENRRSFQNRQFEKP